MSAVDGVKLESVPGVRLCPETAWLGAIFWDAYHGRRLHRIFVSEHAYFAFVRGDITEREALAHKV